MTNANESAIRAVLEAEVELYSGKPLAQLPHAVHSRGAEVDVRLTLPFPAARYSVELRDSLSARLPPGTRLEVQWQAPAPSSKRSRLTWRSWTWGCRKWMA